MIIIKNLVLTDNKIKLITLSQEHFNALAQVATDKRIWQYAHLDLFEPTLFKEKWFDKAMQQMQKTKRWPFAVMYDDKIVGSTSLYDFDTSHKSLSLGYTWYHPQFWGSRLNTAVKLLLLRHVFEELQFNRVAFYVDEENLRSCKAVLKLGAKQEGILRNHMVRPDNTIRNSVIFSIIRDEWPRVLAENNK